MELAADFSNESPCFSPSDITRQKKMIERAKDALRSRSSLKIGILVLEALEGVKKARAHCKNLRGVKNGDMRLGIRLARHACLALCQRVSCFSTSAVDADRLSALEA